MLGLSEVGVGERIKAYCAVEGRCLGGRTGARGEIHRSRNREDEEWVWAKGRKDGWETAVSRGISTIPAHSSIILERRVCRVVTMRLFHRLRRGEAGQSSMNNGILHGC